MAAWVAVERTVAIDETEMAIGPARILATTVEEAVMTTAAGRTSYHVVAVGRRINRDGTRSKMSRRLVLTGRPELLVLVDEHLIGRKRLYEVAR